MKKITILLSDLTISNKVTVGFPIGYQLMVITNGDDNYLCRGIDIIDKSCTLGHVNQTHVNGAINLLRKYYGEDIQIDYKDKQ